MTLKRITLFLALALAGSLSAESHQAADACNQHVLKVNPGFIGSSDALEIVREEIEVIAPYAFPILIVGDSGSGKEVAARMIHERSGRPPERFITYNMASVPDDLIDSILFGHVKGAFTGANGSAVGLIEQADGGTLFLDEFGDASPKVQKALLRALDGHRYRRVGGKEELEMNARFILATNVDLNAAVEAKTFRADLYYRLTTYPIVLPPLSQHREDIPAIANAFLKKLHREHPDKSEHQATHLSEEAMAALMQHSWPGNVRELEKILTRGFVRAEAAQITLSDIMPLKPISTWAEVAERPRPAPKVTVALPALPKPVSAPVPLTIAAPIEPDPAQDKKLIVRLLNEEGGSVRNASLKLRIGEQTLRRKMKALQIRIGIEAPAQRRGHRETESIISALRESDYAWKLAAEKLGLGTSNLRVKAKALGVRLVPVTDDESDLSFTGPEF